MSTLARDFVILAAVVVFLTAAILHLDLSLPVSSMNGQWQIQDWFDHPEATVITHTTPVSTTGGLGASTNNRFERPQVASSVSHGGPDVRVSEAAP